MTSLLARFVQQRPIAAGHHCHAVTPASSRPRSAVKIYDRPVLLTRLLAAGVGQGRCPVSRAGRGEAAPGVEERREAPTRWTETRRGLKTRSRGFGSKKILYDLPALLAAATSCQRYLGAYSRNILSFGSMSLAS